MKLGILGFEGFVGSAFFEVFSEDKKYSVTGINRANYKSNIGSEFDVLINAGGNSSKLLAEKDPVKDFELNVIGTLQCLQDLKCKNYVHISTVEVYPEKDNQDKTTEDTEINPELLTKYGLSKYVGELIAKKYSQSWMILRLAGMVGKNMKKGPAYDILELKRLFLSDKSRLHFMNTRDVAGTAKFLIEKKRFNRIYNVVGRGNVELSEFAKIAGVKLSETGNQEYVLDISTEKLNKEKAVPASIDTVKDFVKSFKVSK